MFKFTSRKLSICLLLIVIFYCNANPTKEAKGGGTAAKGGGKAAKGGGKASKPAKGKDSSTKKDKVGNASDEDKSLLVNTTCGVVKGVWQYTLFTNTKYRSFKAIRYAKPPLGKLRFRKPEEIEPWNETLITTNEYGASCLERVENEKSNKKRDEDCLFLNIFTPADIPKGKKLPVMFFIHGGSFWEGAGDDKYYGPDPFMEKGRDVILVTINYRLAMFGFMCIDADISGNAGLVDQQMALQWIDKHIEAFGGDKNHKTLFGQSAGSQSTHLQMLSPVSRPLVERYIMMSGKIGRCPVDTDVEENILDAFSIHFGEELKELNDGKNYRFRDNYVVLKRYLETVPSKLLQKRFENLYHWSPVVEGRSNTTKPFITEQPRQVYATQQINAEAMFGHTTEEYADRENRTKFKRFVDDLQVERYRTLMTIYGMNQTKYRTDEKLRNKYIDAMLRYFKCYFEDFEKINVTSDADFCRYQKMLSDDLGYQIQELARIHSLKSKRKAYYYIFGVSSKLNYVSRGLEPNLDLAMHSEEIPYLFLSKAHQKIYETLWKSKDPKDIQAMTMRQKFADFIIGFAKTGFKNNTQGYEPVGDDFKSIYIGNDGIKPHGAPNKKAYLALRQAREDLKEWLNDPLLPLITSK